MTPPLELEAAPNLTSDWWVDVSTTFLTNLLRSGTVLCVSIVGDFGADWRVVGVAWVNTSGAVRLYARPPGNGLGITLPQPGALQVKFDRAPMSMVRA